MISLAQLRQHRAWLKLQLPAALLITLLQRTPVVRVLTAAEELATSSPLGAVLKSVLAATASLGAVHSLAGATVLVVSPPSPASGKVGTALNPIGFNVDNTINIMSWSIGGTLPPGLRIVAAEDTTKVLTGPGTLDATGGGMDDGYGGMIGGISSTHPILMGTPTTAGNFTITLQAFEFAALSGLASNTFSYSVNVAADVTPPTTVAPSISAQPQSFGVATGGTITLSVTASGTPAPSFQWSKNGTAITGATNATLSIPNATVADSGSYTVFITNSAGNVTSTAASVTVAPPATQGTAPSITQSPTAQTVIAGATVAFNVTATGSPAPTYQWRKDGVALAGQTKPSLILTGVTAANAGSYTVVVSNGVLPAATSTAATLAISGSSDFGHLTNLAIFATLTPDVPSFTVATVIGPASSSTKPTLFRAVGPSLGQLGVGGFVVDTTMDLFAGSTLAATNDNWGGTTSLTNAMASVGAFAYASAGAKDSAIFLPNAATGSYSVKISGVGGATGVVLAEIYDATPGGTFTAASPRLLDVSVLKQIAAGESLTVGFNVGGSTSRTVLIRAVGPTLTSGLGIPGAMADPQLTLFNGASALIASNDDWGGDAQVNAAFDAVGAFRFGVPTSKDSVIIATLAPGAYSAVVKGGNNSSGLTVVEVYDVP